MMALYAALSGLVIWTAQFAAIYGVTAIACARGYGDQTVLGLQVVPLVVVLATLVALALNGLVLVRARSRSRALAVDGGAPSDVFLARLTYLVSALSLAAIAWNGLPALVLEVC